MKELGLYLHIPFCVKKCDYCDFLSFVLDRKSQSLYVQALVHEIKSHQDKFTDYRVKTIFLGGGTPSVLNGEEIKEIFRVLYQVFAVGKEAEITMEVNPESAGYGDMLLWREAGVNRLSIGLQSAEDAELKLMGRVHDYGQFLKAYDHARKAGFTNINVDIISGLPKQTLKRYKKTLEQLVALKPEHISAYALLVEEETPYGKKYGMSGDFVGDLPDEETDRLLYAYTKEMLQQSGYVRYEISNYAKAGYVCRHNLGYWNRTAYLGLGLGASSFLDNVRFRQTSDFDAYIQMKFDRQGEEILTCQSQMEEFMYLGLRKIQGVSMQAFETYFGKELLQVYGKQIKRLEKLGLLEMSGGQIRLTAYGIDISNCVLAEFLL